MGNALAHTDSAERKWCGVKRYADIDKLIEELNQTYKGSMTDTVIMPLGMENWLNDRARHIPEKLSKYQPTKEELAAWNEQANELHAEGGLDSTIKELAVICACNEEHHLDHLQTECYRRALDFLVCLRQIITG